MQLTTHFVVLRKQNIKTKIMYKVYLDIVTKRLIISEQELTYQLLMSSTDREFAKMYCLGFIYGNSAQGFEVINKAEEFV